MDTNKYNKITNKYKTRFGISSKLIQSLHKDLYNLYSNTNLKNIVKPKSIHNIIHNLFINEYYPIVSKNYKLNAKTNAVIMGTTAFNLHIPDKLKKILYIDTDDIDLKIYTTELHYNKSNHTAQNTKHVLSLFRYIIITIVFFMKQIIAEIMDFTNKIFIGENIDHKEHKDHKINIKSDILKYNSKIHKKKTHKKTNNKGIVKNTKAKIKQKHIKNKSKKKHNKHSKNGKNIKNKKDKKDKKDKKNKKSQKSQKGGNTNTLTLIKNYQKSYGLLNSIGILMQIKNRLGDESIQEDINITNLSYDEIYNIVFTKINDIDLLITTKIKYKFKYSKLLVIPVINPSLTFSDTKIYYPNMYENATFYAYYLLTNKYNEKLNTTLDKLYKENININNIIKLNSCGNNCNYIGVKSLQIDLIIMLQYAEFMNSEEYSDSNSKIIVPMGAIFKYIRYFTKYIRLYIIIKFYNKTLNKDYVNISLKILQYLKYKIINKTNIEPEITPLNIQFKTAINSFHQSFFIKEEMYPEYDLLKDLVYDYNNIKKYINKSRLLFTDLYKTYEEENKSKDKNTKENNPSLLNILKLVIDEDGHGHGHEQEHANSTSTLTGGRNKSHDHKKHTHDNDIILYNDNDNNDDNNDDNNFDIDSIDSIGKITKDKINDKIKEILDNEIKNMKKILSIM